MSKLKLVESISEASVVAAVNPIMLKKLCRKIGKLILIYLQLKTFEIASELLNNIYPVLLLLYTVPGKLSYSLIFEKNCFAYFFK